MPNPAPTAAGALAGGVGGTIVAGGDVVAGGSPAGGCVIGSVGLRGTSGQRGNLTSGTTLGAVPDAAPEGAVGALGVSGSTISGTRGRTGKKPPGAIG